VTESEWLAATDPTPMLEFLRDKVSDRKLRLFVVASIRTDWHRIDSDEVRRAVHVAEQYADGLTTHSQLRDNRNLMAGLWDDLYDRSRHRGMFLDTELRICALTLAATLSDQMLLRISERPHSRVHGRGLTEETQLPCLRDIFGNPLRPVTSEPSWLTSTVRSLSDGIYQDRAFDRLPILADALQDAGCDNDDVLGHCRSEGPHVRGCWVIDLLTGRK
jgi:hypothetical protein